MLADLGKYADALEDVRQLHRPESRTIRAITVSVAPSTGRWGTGKAAIADYSEALRLDPRDSYSLRERGVERYECGELAGALTDLNVAIVNDESDIRARYYRANVFADLDWYAEAAMTRLN